MKKKNFIFKHLYSLNTDNIWISINSIGYALLLMYLIFLIIRIQPLVETYFTSYYLGFYIHSYNSRSHGDMLSSFNFMMRININTFIEGCEDKFKFNLRRRVPTTLPMLGEGFHLASLKSQVWPFSQDLLR